MRSAIQVTHALSAMCTYERGKSWYVDLERVFEGRRTRPTTAASAVQQCSEDEFVPQKACTFSRGVFARRLQREHRALMRAWRVLLCDYG